MELNRKNLLNQSSCVDSRVEVNQRHLIDKILARELIQNANDALATQVVIEFKVISDKLVSITIKNNGKYFSEEDWTRLRKIAEGNPDEDKIGFFGVGFYSIFSICEEPYIESGNQCMAFYWRGDQLYTKRGSIDNYNTNQKEDSDIPKEKNDSHVQAHSSTENYGWTSFYLQLYEPMDLVDYDSLCPFLCKSLLFTRNIQSITAIENSILLMTVSRSLNYKNEVEDVPSDCLKYSMNGLFKLERFQQFQLKLTVEKLYDSRKKSFLRSILKFANLQPENEEWKASGNYEMLVEGLDCTLSVHLSSSMKSQMERLLKKQPKKTIRLELICNSFEENRLSSTNLLLFGDIFPTSKNGRIFIGFSTHQSTGLAVHFNLPLIPTVERESIDFVDPTLRIWNEDLVGAAGVYLRILYEIQFKKILEIERKEICLDRNDSMETDSKISQEISNTSDSLDSHGNLKLSLRHLKLLFDFAFLQTAPANAVHELLSFNFFRGSSAPLSLWSFLGPTNLAQMRLIPEEVCSFVTKTPTIPSVSDIKAALQASNIFTTEISLNLFDFIKNNNLLLTLSAEDILRSLTGVKLTDSQLIACLKWLFAIIQGNLINKEFIKKFKSVLLIRSSSGKYHLLKEFEYFADYNLFCHGSFNLPESCFPLNLSKIFLKQQLYSIGLKELPSVDWLQFNLNNQQFESDLGYLEKVMNQAARIWANSTEESAMMIISILMEKRCIPTRNHGLQLPRNSFLPSVDLFEDLPRAKFSQRKYLTDEFLLKIGVKAAPSVEMILDKMQELKWNQEQLLKYFCSIQAHLTENELDKLRSIPLFTARNSLVVAKKRISECYFPSKIAEYLNLFLLEWHGSLAVDSSIGRFLRILGMKFIIEFQVLMKLFGSKDPVELSAAGSYFSEHYDSFYKKEYPSFLNVDFLLLADKKGLGSPLSCFSDRDCFLLNLPVLCQELVPFAPLLQVKCRPGGKLLLQVISHLKLKIEEAPRVFSFLLKGSAEFSLDQKHQLADISFVPVMADSQKGLDVFYKKPKEVYIASSRMSEYSSSSSKVPSFMKNFTFVSFGAEGDAFLRFCGSESEPNAIQLAILLIENSKLSRKAYLVADQKSDIADQRTSMADHQLSVTEILDVIRILASNWQILKKDARIWNLLQTKQCLLACHPEFAIESDDSVSKMSFFIESLVNIALFDDAISQQLFKISCAPTEPIIEKFYEELGAKWISQSVRVSYQYSNLISETEASVRLARLIKERSPILVYDFNPQISKTKKITAKELSFLLILQSEEISICREYGGVLKKQATTCCISSWKELSRVAKGISSAMISNSYCLLITENYEIFDVAMAVGILIYGQSNRVGNALMISALLSSSLVGLREKGVPVDRLLHGSHGKMSDQEASNVPSVYHAENRRNEEWQRNIDSTESTVIEPQSHEVQKSLGNSIEKSLQKSDAKSAHKSQSNRKLSIFSSIFKSKPNITNKATNSTVSETKSAGIQQRVLESNELSKILQASVVSCRANEGKFIESGKLNRDVIAKEAAVPEYCDLELKKSLEFDSIIEGFEFYIEAENSHFLIENNKRLCKYAKEILTTISNIFGLSTKSMHIFYSDSETIAFNRNKALFFNVKYEMAKMNEGVSQRLIFWYMVACHELAHNFVAAHDEHHEYYMSVFAEIYMMRLMKTLQNVGA